MRDSLRAVSSLDSARMERDLAEGAKLRAERREIELRLARPWYRKEGFFKALVGGLLALPVMWFFFDQIIRPVYTVENKKLWVDVEEARLEVRLKEQALVEATATLAAARKELEAAWDEAQRAGEEIARREATLKSQQARLVADYERLLAEEKSASAELAAEVARLQASLTTNRSVAAVPLVIRDHRLQGEGIHFVASPLSGVPMETRALVLHISASDSLASTVHSLQKPEARSSDHILIGRDGTIVQMVPFNRTATHAGNAKFANGQTFNQASISLSLVNAGRLDKRLEKKGETYRAWYGKEIDAVEVLAVPGDDGGDVTYWHKPTLVQLRTLEDLIARLVNAYPITTLVGRDEISGDHKVDPGPAVPVQRLREGFLGGR